MSDWAARRRGPGRLRLLYLQDINLEPAYIGIDVAFAKRKPLPVYVCTWQNGRLVPEAVRRLSLKPPRGKGNRAAFDEEAVGAFADAAAEYVEGVCDALQLEPRRIGLDAPSAPRPDRLARRAAKDEQLALAQELAERARHVEPPD